ncbi:PEP/pyruvate-binding domain-containing protein [Stackebrandtia nassauensis]|uniref:Pyruvate phosphate dikinase PEP/pyruvate-binding protein n=1 Tax=Stackebrandtia nassauensis (strain DSM 44728 / CIP 108903 / NRRL B-16338 / NBRC 102104 / LLR-40K-21) TaxID=446470 RepID=D3PX19_STANL|nr:PEP/pyruvate-binding domain-containing protein [Stackebrandtia nassauensis]ADD45243.1 pyruvate phosphate dikinase PEP/pyruvate- binding protein [Stackebrandtia nassauensis DSM 44728]
MSVVESALVVELAEVGPQQLAQVGGKAANLGVLLRAGLPVPSGVCVTTAAYRRVAEAAGVPEILSGGTVEAGKLAARVREAILAAEVDADIAEAVRAHADGPVAVRSSATAEDLPDASFAGQQDTFLNMIGPDAVLDAVRRCWASLWTERAVAYREANGIDHAEVALAVVIQDMVEPSVAGVMFTANPVTGRRNQTVIDASPGLGEAVVSGAVNPDHFVVDPDDRISERRLGDKRMSIHSLPGGGTSTMEREDVEAACLTDEQLRELAALGRKVSAHYGSPQDTEWVIDADGKLWLTQARPITTLYPLPDTASPQPLRAYFSVAAGQGMYRPVTPMGLAAFRLLAGGAARTLGFPLPDPERGPAVFNVAGQRIYIEVTPALRSRMGRTIVSKLLGVMEARSAVVLRELMDWPQFSITQPSRRPVLRRIARIAWRYRIPPRLVAAVISPRRALANVERIRRDFAALSSPMPDASPTRRLDHVEQLLGRDLFPNAPRLAPAAFAGFGMLGAAAWLLRGRTEPGELQTVLRGVPNNVTTEMDLALWRLARDAGADPASAAVLRETPAAELARHRTELPPVLSAGLDEFLAEYGHRAVAEIDLGMPRWSDDPGHILAVLANYLRLDDPELAPDRQFERGAAEAEAKIRDLAHRAGWLRGPMVRFALGRARQLVGVREMPKNCLVGGLAAARAHLKIIGETLVTAGQLDTVDDVFFLTPKELRQPRDYRELVASRRADYDRELRRKHQPRVMLSDGTEPEAVASREIVEGELTGTPASSGEVTGIARVVLDPLGAHLEPGEILIAPSTDPGWTPLFLTAGGLVMEMGGANSHGAVVAREYGIPAVVGVHDACERVQTGQTITVDGTAGAIKVHEAEEE